MFYKIGFPDPVTECTPPPPHNPCCATVYYAKYISRYVLHILLPQLRYKLELPPLKVLDPSKQA